MQKTVENLTDVADLFQIPVFILSVEDEKIVRFAKINKFHETVTGVNSGDLQGKTPHETFPERVADTLMRNYMECVTSRQLYQYEELLHLPSGEQWWETTLSPLIEGGKCTGILGVAFVKTASKQTERDLAAAIQQVSQINADLQAITSTTAHDLRGPLRQAKLILDLISDGFRDLGDGKFGLINTGKDIIDKALDLIDTNLSHVSESAELRSGVAEVDMGHWFADIIAILDPLARQDIKYPEITVECEKFVLDTGLRNLIDNATKYAKSRMLIDIHEREGELVFIVADDGPGFDHPDFEIGAPPPAPLSHENNTGIGLATTRSLIEARKGKIWIDEAVFETGATLCFSIAGRIVEAAVRRAG